MTFKLRPPRPPRPDPLQAMVTALRRIRDDVADNPDADPALRRRAREVVQTNNLAELERRLVKRRTRPRLRIRPWRPGDPEPAP